MAKAFQCDKCKKIFLGGWTIRLRVSYGENGDNYPHELCGECSKGFSAWIRDLDVLALKAAS